MTRGYELLTVKDTAHALMKSEQAVRRLIRVGKLAALRESGRYLLNPDAIRAYVDTMPHPVPVMAALYDARQILTLDQVSKKLWPALRQDSRYKLSAGAFDTYFMPEALPLCAEIVEAVKVENYSRVLALALDLERVRTDYQMLYAPLPRLQDEARQKAEGEDLMPTLFSENGGRA